MRTPEAVFLGTTGSAGSTVAWTPRSATSISPILRSGACARTTDGRRASRNVATAVARIDQRIGLSNTWPVPGGGPEAPELLGGLPRPPFAKERGVYGSWVR